MTIQSVRQKKLGMKSHQIECILENCGSTREVPHQLLYYTLPSDPYVVEPEKFRIAPKH